MQMRWKYLHFLIQHEITVIAPNMNAASAHQAMDYDDDDDDDDDYHGNVYVTSAPSTAKSTKKKIEINKIQENTIHLQYIFHDKLREWQVANKMSCITRFPFFRIIPLIRHSIFS